MQNLINILNQSFPLQKKSVEEFDKIKVRGMNFEIQRYYAKGLGNVSLMHATGFFGLMKMDTFIINPTECDAPLFSYDRVFAMGNDTLILELYDTMLGKPRLEEIASINRAYKELPDHDLGQHWYDHIKFAESSSKKGRKKDMQSFNNLTKEYFKAYVEVLKRAEKCDAAEKREKAAVYVDGLLANGGPSTDVFKKHYGKDKTEYLFRKILFGIEV